MTPGKNVCVLLVFLQWFEWQRHFHRNLRLEAILQAFKCYFDVAHASGEDPRVLWETTMQRFENNS